MLRGVLGSELNTDIMTPFLILHHTVTLTQIDGLCGEMDRAMMMHPEPGRRPGTDRYTVRGHESDYPHLNQWLASLPLPQDQLITFTAFVRQTASSGLHTDHNPRQGRGYSVLLPLRSIRDTDATVVFAESADHQHRFSLLNNPHTPHRATLNLGHCPSWCDRLTLLGIYHYRLGSAVLFDAHRLHCSTDWRTTTPGRLHKDYVLVHTTQRDSLTYRETESPRQQ